MPKKNFFSIFFQILSPRPSIMEGPEENGRSLWLIVRAPTSSLALLVFDRGEQLALAGTYCDRILPFLFGACLSHQGCSRSNIRVKIFIFVQKLWSQKN
jgi:hypothetical protein